MELLIYIMFCSHFLGNSAVSFYIGGCQGRRCQVASAIQRIWENQGNCLSWPHQRNLLIRPREQKLPHWKPTVRNFIVNDKRASLNISFGYFSRWDRRKGWNRGGEWERKWRAWNKRRRNRGSRGSFRSHIDWRDHRRINGHSCVVTEKKMDWSVWV